MDAETKGTHQQGQKVKASAFLAFNSDDRVVVEQLAHYLKIKRIKLWFEPWSLVAGERVHTELKKALHSSTCCAVFIGANGAGQWQTIEAEEAFAVSLKRLDFRVFAVLLPGAPKHLQRSSLPTFLDQNAWVDLRDGIETEDQRAKLVRAIRGRKKRGLTPRSDQSPLSRPPYLGLHFFTEDDAPLFFGREVETQWLLEKFLTTRILTIIGASGSGKSSIVRAGLVPAIRASLHKHGSALQLVDSVPHSDPIEDLALALVCAFPVADKVNEAIRLKKALLEDPKALRMFIEIHLRGLDRKLRSEVVIFVDQLEELFLHNFEASTRNRLFESLILAATDPGSKIKVIFSLRADFFHRVGEIPRLARVVEECQVFITEMNRSGLLRAIIEPAASAGVSFQQSLPETILDDLGNEPGNLPLLAHALSSIWDRRTHKMITLTSYHDIGGVRNAIAHRAEQVFQSLTEKQQQLARKLFLRMTEVTDGAAPSRRRVLLRNIMTDGDAPSDWDELLQQLTLSRLIVQGRGNGLLDVAHEAVLRNWPRLAEWIDESQNVFRIHRRLTDSANEWERLNRDGGQLWRGAALEEVVVLKEEIEPRLNALEREFLDASIQLEAGRGTNDSSMMAVSRLLHELRTPIVATRGAIDLVRSKLKKQADTTLDQYLDDVDSWMQLMGRQIANANVVWRTGGDIKPQKSRVAIGRDVILPVVHLAKPLLRAFRGAQIEILTSPTEGLPSLFVDKNLLQTAIFNLLSNAIKASRHDGDQPPRIMLECSVGTSSYRIDCIDWGVGFDHAQSEDLFKKGYREKSAVLRDVSGSGLGLYVTRQIIRAHGGDVQIRSQRNPTIVSITLPLSVSAMP